ncbi:hypothetical protein GCM10014719_35870 [Planomonospora parontospora subsp. antibiotica]|nr:hypothetical protein GCM10014719_35870 [Planomonospora parontospora subsp. antibiotica]GII16600.1 hypothetical protein Ppa05_33260 [Planomonospora parontospora subsp. antibiotica]
MPRLPVVPLEQRPGAALLQQGVDPQGRRIDVLRRDGVEDGAQAGRDPGEFPGLLLGDLPVPGVAGPQALGGGGSAVTTGSSAPSEADPAGPGGAAGTGRISLRGRWEASGRPPGGLREGGEDGRSDLRRPLPGHREP